MNEHQYKKVLSIIKYAGSLNDPDGIEDIGSLVDLLGNALGIVIYQALKGKNIREEELRPEIQSLLKQLEDHIVLNAMIKNP